MYILKNALKSIGRSKGRNILIGIIVLVIATSACIGLSIRQAAQSAKESTLESLSVTATINYDRKAMMENMAPGGQGESGKNGGFDREEFANIMRGASSLTLDEYLTYAKAESVDDFYYTLTVLANGSDSFEAVTNDFTSSDGENSSAAQNDTNNQMTPPDGMQMPDGMDGGPMGNMRGMQQSDFSVVGYSADNAMTSFVDGTASVEDGSVFEEGTDNPYCIISSELATYNDVEVGDTITLTNPNYEDETFTLNVVGIYTDTTSNENSMSPMGFGGSDPANSIYMSYTALQAILDNSEDNSTTVTDEETGREYESALTGSLTGTYIFEDTDAYNRFEEEVREMGLAQEYVVVSEDLSAFENSLLPLETLSSIAGWFLLIILIVGAIILVVINIFNVRERKYEIGVLTAMGMEKIMVAAQFLLEIFMITLIAVTMGIGIGAVTSVPVTNALLENQVASQQQQLNQREENFGRPDPMGDGMDMSGQRPEMGDMPDAPQGGFMNMMPGAENVTRYVTEINSAMNFTVVLQMFAIALLLTLVSGFSSMLFIMRYEPLKILANRD